LSLTEFYKGKPYSWLVVGCGRNPEYDAQLAVFDLGYEPDGYTHPEPKEVAAKLDTLTVRGIPDHDARNGSGQLGQDAHRRSSPTRSEKCH